MKRKILFGIVILIFTSIILLACWLAAIKIEYKINDYKVEKIVSEKINSRICFTSSYSIRLKNKRVVTTLDGQEWDISEHKDYGMGDDAEYIAIIFDTKNTIHDVFSVIHTTAKRHMPFNKNCMDLK